MSSEFLCKVAEVLEKTAAMLDEQDAVKHAAAKESRTRVSRDIGEKIAAALGEELPESVLERMADPELASAFNKLAARIPLDEAPDSLGDVADDPRRSKTASADDAGDNFVNWVLS